MTPSERLLIVNADDFGLTEGVSRAIIDAHRDGVVTSTSLLALGPAFDRTASWLQDAPALGLGAHLALVGEDPPVLSAREIPTLVNRDGHLDLSWRMFLGRAAAGRVDPGDVRRELAAQFERIDGAGLRVDHVDSHQNLHLWPAVRDVVLDLADERDVRVVRVTRSRARSLVGFVVRTLSGRLERACDRRGFRYPGATTGLDEAGHLDQDRMIGAVARLAATGARTAELATHPGPVTDAERDRYRWSYQWGDEFAALRSPAVRSAVHEFGFTLGTFADLASVGDDA